MNKVMTELHQEDLKRLEAIENELIEIKEQLTRLMQLIPKPTRPIDELLEILKEHNRQIDAYKKRQEEKVKPVFIETNDLIR
jgi:DNA repair ATPase RecN